MLDLSFCLSVDVKLQLVVCFNIFLLFSSKTKLVQFITKIFFIFVFTVPGLILLYCLSV
jgi:hypothetical protein